MNQLRRVWLFVRIAGRAWDVAPSGRTVRLGVALAWRVAGVVWGRPRGA